MARAALLTLAMLASLTACGDAASVETAPQAPTPAPSEPQPQSAVMPTGAARSAGSGGPSVAGRGTPDEKPAPAPELELRVCLGQHIVPRAAPIRARIEIRNVSKESVRLASGRTDVARRTRFVIQRGGREIPVGAGAPLAAAAAAANSVSLVRDDDVLLAPGDRLDAEVDLLAAFEETPSYVDGRVEFVARYQGDAAVGRDAVQGWNTDPAHVVQSKPCDVELALPDWLAALGATQPLLDEMRNTAAVFQPGAPDAEKVTARIAAKGQAAFGSLLFLTRGMGGRAEREVELAGRALALLRCVGDPVLAAMSSAAGVTEPSVQMALAILLQDHSERSRLAPEREIEKMLHDVGSGGPSAAMLAIHVDGTVKAPPFSYLLDDKGTLTVGRGSGDAETRVCRQLPPDQLALLRKAVASSRLTAWRPLERLEERDEGSVSFTLLQGTRTIHRITLAEREALRANPLPAALLDTFAKVAAGFAPPKR